MPKVTKWLDYGKDHYATVSFYNAPEQRRVVILRHYGKCDFKDIAARTGVSINTALGRMRYAIINLRRLAEEHNMYIEL